MASLTLSPGSAGIRRTFADIGETVGAWLGRPAGPHGQSMLSPADIAAARDFNR
jgi:phosphopentomutase